MYDFWIAFASAAIIGLVSFIWNTIKEKVEDGSGFADELANEIDITKIDLGG